MNTYNIKTLRKQTGAGLLDCKKALQESENDLEKAVLWLRKKGLSDAVKKLGREASEGLIFSYIHGEDGKLAVMVEVNCETDFVARTDRFKDFVKNIALHIAASNPLYITEEEIPQKEKEKELEVIKAQKTKKTLSKASSKTNPLNQKMNGSNNLNHGSAEKSKSKDFNLKNEENLPNEEHLLKEWVSEVTLLKQKYVKDLKISVEDYLKETIARIGENIIIRRFIRWKLGN